VSRGGAPALSPLEVASGLVLDPRRARARLRAVSPAMSPRAALEAAVLPALRRPPCLVSFSGGRDSSAVLAVAASLARRHGLPLPVPATNRFPGGVRTDEADWQERVVAHLGLSDWLKLEHQGELDCIGPVARAALRRHGLLWPCNAHFHIPILEAAAGGSVLTGIGGDEALSPSRWARVRAVAARRARPVPRDVLAAAFAFSPRPVRRQVMLRRQNHPWPWLRPAAIRRVTRALAAEAAGEPVRWRGGFEWLLTSRSLATGKASLALLAADAGARIAHPLLDTTFVAALAALPPAARFERRREAMHMLVGDLLPEELVLRPTKASFDEAFWHESSRAFTASWTGGGVDHQLVDTEALKAIWTSEEPDARTFTLLQAAWLASTAGELEQPVHGGADRVPSRRPAQLPRGELGEVDQHLGARGREPDAALLEQPCEPLRGA
jgi:asparagine synthetase B (glutamine-hydrolysing)